MGIIQSFGLQKSTIGALALGGAALPIWMIKNAGSGEPRKAAREAQESRATQLRLATGVGALGFGALAATRPSPLAFAGAIAMGAAHVGAWIGPSLIGDPKGITKAPMEEAPDPTTVMPDRDEPVAPPVTTPDEQPEVDRNEPPPASDPSGSDTPKEPHDQAAVFKGTGTWIDLYDYHLLENPEATVRTLKEHDVQTIYLETSKYDRDYAIYQPEQVDALLKAAHAEGIDVVAWYFPGLGDLEQDLERSMRAVNYRSASGESFDGFALDIEAQEVANIDERVSRLVTLSERIRAGAGEDYPLGAITPPPAKNTNPGGAWPKFPWQELAHEYDAWLPMSFFTQWRPAGVADAAAVRDGFLADIKEIRDETKGAPQLPIHVIGEVAQTANSADLQGMVQAVRDGGAEGASIYDMATSKAEEWRTTDALRFLNGE